MYAVLGIGLAQHRDLLEFDYDLDPALLRPGAVPTIDENRLIADPAGDEDFRFIIEVKTGVTTLGNGVEPRPIGTSFRDGMKQFTHGTLHNVNQHWIHHIQSHSELFWKDGQGFSNVQMENTHFVLVPESSSCALVLLASPFVWGCARQACSRGAVTNQA